MTTNRATLVAALLFSAVMGHPAAAAPVAQVTASAPRPTGVVPAERRTAWQPGIPGGVPTSRSRICAKLSPSGGSDTAAIQAAIDRCPSNGVVQLSAGTFMVTSPIWLKKSGVTLRGAGRPQTKLWGSTNNTIISIFPGWPEFSRVVDVAGSVAKGATSIKLAAGSGTTFQVGDIVIIDQLDDPSYLFNGDEPYFKRGPTNYQNMPSSSGYRFMGQTVEVERIAGDTLFISTPIHQRFDAAFAPQVWKAMVTVRNSGVEDLYLTGGGNGTPMIHFMDAAYCWVKNVESDGSVVGGSPGNPNGTNTGNGLAGAHSSFEKSFRCEYRDSYVHDATNIRQGGGAYGLGFMTYSSECLIENNVIYNLNKPVQARVSGGGNVCGYNYIDDAWTGADPKTQETGIDFGHSSFPHHDLYEGNWVPQIGADNVWGNSGWCTAFRNWATGIQKRTPKMEPQSHCNMVSAVGIQSRAINHNIVGNVLGMPGQGQILRGARQSARDQEQLGRVAHRVGSRERGRQLREPGL